MSPIIIHVIFLVTLFPAVNSLELFGNRGETIYCSKSKIDHNVTLAEGRKAGIFLKANKSVATMKQCLRRCCQTKGCDVAFMSNSECYSVKCKSLDACAPTMNTNKRMSVTISYVAKPKTSLLTASHDKNVELEVTDNFIAEPTQQSSFAAYDKDEDDINLQQVSRAPWKETKDAAIAICCGFVAVGLGVAGVIIMTRQLVEDEDTYPYTTSGRILSDLKQTLPRIDESPKENNLGRNEKHQPSEGTNELEREITNQLTTEKANESEIKRQTERTNGESIIEVTTEIKHEVNNVEITDDTAAS